jgi:hypothetical protein
MSRAKVSPLPAPACQLGYTQTQLDAILIDVDHFGNWMRGQTMVICDGRYYDYDAKAYEDTGCGPHGAVVYAWDVTRYIEGGPIVD